MLLRINILLIFLILTLISDSEQNPRRTGHGDEQVLDNHAPVPMRLQDINPAEYKNKMKALKLLDSKGHHRWPMGVVPYFIDAEIYDTATANHIVKAMTVIESASCVIFNELSKVPEESNDAWLHITNPKEDRDCIHTNSIVNEGETVVVLGFDCLHPDEILHALLHGIGFRDEVTHPRREQYIRVQWENIQPKYRPLFRIQHENVPYKQIEYDPLSIMHFHDRAFSVNGAATVLPVIPGLQMGGSHVLSQLDVMKLKLAFEHECSERKIGDLFESCKVALSSQKTNAKALAGSSAGEEHPDDVKNMNEEVNEEDGHNMNERDNENDVHNLNEGDQQENVQKLGEDEDNVQKLLGNADVLNDEINKDDHNVDDEGDKKPIQLLQLEKESDGVGDERVTQRLLFAKPNGRK